MASNGAIAYYSMYISISHPCDFQSLLSHLCTEPTTIRFFFHPKLHNTLCIINKCLRVNERMSECTQVSHIRALEVMLMHTNCVSYLFPHIIVIFFIFVRFFLRNAKIYDNERLNVKSSQLRQCRKNVPRFIPRINNYHNFYSMFYIKQFVLFFGQLTVGIFSAFWTVKLAISPTNFLEW